MASSYSLRFRLNFQAPGDNLNLWGTVLNVGVFQLLEDAIAKRVAFALSGAKTLSTSNGAADEARSAFLDVTSGTGGAVTIPSVEKIYLMRNGASGDVTVTTGAGTVATLESGELNLVVCDGSNVRALGANAQSFKAYADALAFNDVELPAQAGANGKFIKSNGTTASWSQVVVGDLANYPADQASRAAALRLAITRESLFLAKHF